MKGRPFATTAPRFSGGLLDSFCSTPGKLNMRMNIDEITDLMAYLHIFIYPGPGSYDSHRMTKWGNTSAINFSSGTFLSNESRFQTARKGVVETAVGPGSYDTPNYLLKKSFNVTMRDNSSQKHDGKI